MMAYPTAVLHIIRQMLPGQFYEKGVWVDHVFDRSGNDADAFSAHEDRHDPVDFNFSDWGI